MSRMLSFLVLLVFLAGCSTKSYKAPLDFHVPAPSNSLNKIPLRVGVMIPPTMPHYSFQANLLDEGVCDFEIGEAVVDGLWKMCRLHFQDAVRIQTTDLAIIDPGIDAIIAPQILSASFREASADIGQALEFSVSMRLSCIGPDDRTLWVDEFSGQGHGQEDTPEEIFAHCMQSGLEDLFNTTVQGMLAQEWWQEERPSLPPVIDEPEISGGWINNSPDSQGALKAAKFAAAEIAGIHQVGDFEQLLSVNTQVVAGTNFNLLILLTDETVWRAVVYENLKGVHEVTRMERVK